jgi:hypothetical protein
MYIPGSSAIWMIQKQIEMSSSLWLSGNIKIYPYLLNFHQIILLRDRRSINPSPSPSNKHWSHNAQVCELFNQWSQWSTGTRVKMTLRLKNLSHFFFINFAYNMTKGSSKVWLIISQICHFIRKKLLPDWSEQLWKKHMPLFHVTQNTFVERVTTPFTAGLI